MTQEISFKQVNNDVNGNPRYVCHFLNLLTEGEKADYSGDWINRRYSLAIDRARKIGGRKFHNKQYGGGIVFQSYNVQETANRIFELLESAE